MRKWTRKVVVWDCPYRGAAGNVGTIDAFLGVRCISIGGKRENPPRWIRESRSVRITVTELKRQPKSEGERGGMEEGIALICFFWVIIAGVILFVMEKGAQP